MSSKKTFVCSDESVNAYGFKVLTDGIQIANFKKNPVLFFNHDTGGSYWAKDPNYTGPLGRWENISKENGQLKADAIFDESDPKGKSLSAKVENDFIRAASIGFRVISTSNDPALMEKGQTYPTITKCELMEISVVDIPANKNALALYDADGNRINLDDSKQLSVALSALNTNPIQKNNSMKLKLSAALTALSVFFGLEAGKDHEIETTPEKLSELNNKLVSLTALEAEKVTLTAAKTKAEGDLKTAQDALALAEAKILKLEGKPDTEPGKPAGEKKLEDEGTYSNNLSDLMKFSFENNSLSEKEMKALATV